MLKIYIYQEFGYWEIKFEGVVRQEVLTPEIVKEEVTIELAGEISTFRTPGVRRT